MLHHNCQIISCTQQVPAKLQRCFYPSLLSLRKIVASCTICPREGEKGLAADWKGLWSCKRTLRFRSRGWNKMALPKLWLERLTHAYRPLTNPLHYVPSGWMNEWKALFWQNCHCKLILWGNCLIGAQSSWACQIFVVGKQGAWSSSLKTTQFHPEQETRFVSQRVQPRDCTGV